MAWLSAAYLVAWIGLYWLMNAESEWGKSLLCFYARTEKFHRAEQLGVMQKLQLNKYAVPINKLSRSRREQPQGIMVWPNGIVNSWGLMRTNWAISRSMIIVCDAAAGNQLETPTRTTPSLSPRVWLCQLYFAFAQKKNFVLYKNH